MFVHDVKEFVDFRCSDDAKILVSGIVINSQNCTITPGGWGKSGIYINHLETFTDQKVIFESGINVIGVKIIFLYKSISRRIRYKNVWNYVIFILFISTYLA